MPQRKYVYMLSSQSNENIEMKSNYGVSDFMIRPLKSLTMKKSFVHQVSTLIYISQSTKR